MAPVCRLCGSPILLRYVRTPLGETYCLRHEHLPWPHRQRYQLPSPAEVPRTIPAVEAPSPKPVPGPD